MIKMQSATYCIDVIRNLMQEKEIPQLPDTVSLQELYAFAKLHNVEAMVFHGLEQLQPDEADPVWQDWQNRAAMLLTQSVVQLAERDALFAAFPAAGIRLLPVKGCWLKEQYPDIDYRQMSDLDMLIEPQKEQEARKLMMALGYQTNPFEDQPNHTGYQKPPYMEVELHTSLLQEDGGYYDDIWSRALPVEDMPGISRLCAEDAYIYYLLHLYKHLQSAGTGIRSVLDSVVYRGAFPDMDRQYLRKELEKLGLWDWTLQLEKLADCWFSSGDPLPEELSEMAVFILCAGSYGTLETYAERQKEKLKEKYRNPVVRFIVYWVMRICRPRQDMEKSYPVLRKLPILLPVFWVYRAVMVFASRPKGIWSHVKVSLSGGKKNG